VIQPPAAIPPVFTSWSPVTLPCRHGWSAALRAATLPAKRASSARTGFALGRCLGLPSPSPPSFPAETRSVTAAAPGRRARTHRYAPSRDRPHGGVTVNRGPRPGTDRSLRRTRAHEKRRPPTCRRGSEVGVPARTAYDRWMRLEQFRSS
jgi:hypothetical protein